MPRSKWLSDLWSEAADFFESFVRAAQEEQRLPTQDELLQHQAYVQGFIDIFAEAQEFTGNHPLCALPMRQKVSNVSLNSTSRTSSEHSFTSDLPSAKILHGTSEKREFTAQEDEFMWKAYQESLREKKYIKHGKHTSPGLCKQLAGQLGVELPQSVGRRLRMLAATRESNDDNYWPDEGKLPATNQSKKTVAESVPALLPPTTKDAFKFTRAEDAAILGAHLSSNNFEARGLAVDNIARGLNRTQVAVRARIQKLLARDAREGDVSSTSSDSSAGSADEEFSAYEQLPPPRSTTSRSTPMSTHPPELPSRQKRTPNKSASINLGPLKKGPYSEEEDAVIWSAYLSCTAEEERSEALLQAAKELRRTPTGVLVHMRALLAEQEGQFESDNMSESNHSLQTAEPTVSTEVSHLVVARPDVHSRKASSGTQPLQPSFPADMDSPPVPDAVKEAHRSERGERETLKHRQREADSPPPPPVTSSVPCQPATSVSQPRMQADTGAGTGAGTISSPATTPTQDIRARPPPLLLPPQDIRVLPPPLPLPPQAAVTAVWAPSREKYARWATPRQVADHFFIRRPQCAHDKAMCVVYGSLVYARQQSRFPSYHRLIDLFLRVCADLARKHTHLAGMTRDDMHQLVDLLLKTGALFQDRGGTIRIDRDIGDFRDLRRCHDRYLISKLTNLTAANHTEVVNALCWPVDASVRDLCDKMQNLVDEVQYSVKKLQCTRRNLHF